jgi:sugar lactone lactonase YvrE
MFRRTTPIKDGGADKKVTAEAIKAQCEVEKSATLLRNKKKSSKLALSSIVILSVCSSLVLSSPFLYLLYTRLGFGAAFPAQPHLTASTSVLPANALEVVAELPVPPGNLAISSKGRIFFNYHPDYKTALKVLEWKDKAPVPFPSESFQQNIITCLSMRIDSKDRLWLLDFANHGISGASRLFGFDLLNKDRLIRNYTFPMQVAGFGSMLNDFQIDPEAKYIYIIDTSLLAATPGLIVYSILDDRSVRVFSGDRSLYGQSTFLNISGSMVKFGPLGIKIHADSIALDRRGRTLYYGAVTSDKLFAVTTQALLKAMATNTTLAPSEVKSVCTEKPMTDGLSMDMAGNIWMTAIEHNALVIALPSPSAPSAGSSVATSYHVLKAIESPLLRWPDGLSFGPDGLYVASSALHLHLTGRDVAAHAPYPILKLGSKHLKNKDLYRGKSYVPTPSGQ